MTASRPSPKRRFRAAAMGLAVALAAGVVAFTAPATAATAADCGDFDMTISGPAEQNLYAPFTYTINAASAASAANPIIGGTSTVILPEGVEFNGVPTGDTSPVDSFTYDAATRTVVFTLNELVSPLVSFAFSVIQVDNTVKSPGDVLTASIACGEGPATTVDTTIVADMDYAARKTAAVATGGDNRTVIYDFAVRTVNWNASTTTTATSATQTFTDIIPAGAVIVSSSAGPNGEWAFTSNPDGTTTAVWVHTGKYGPASGELGGARLEVNYPADVFTDVRPPVNEVLLSTTDAQGNVYDGLKDVAQGPAFQGGTGTGVAVEKSYNGLTGPATLQSGQYLASYLVAAGYVSSTGETLDEMVVEDSAQQNPANAEFFDHASIFRLGAVFNPTMAALNAPVTLHYITNTSSSWTSVTSPAMMTGTDWSINVQNVGSSGFTFSHAAATVDLPRGQWMTGWRFTIDAAAQGGVPAGGDVRISTGFQPSAAALSDGTTIAGLLQNTAAAQGTVAGGELLEADSNTLNFTINDQVNVITTVKAPSTITVSENAVFQVGTTNVNPAGVAYPDTVTRVVLPVGVYYDPSVGVSRTSATSITGLNVPAPGDGLTITLETVTDAAGTHQVVVFTFEETESVYKAGDAKIAIREDDGYWYSIPTVVTAKAVVTGGGSTSVTSWSRVEAPEYVNMPMGFGNGYFAADPYFGSVIPQIAKSEAQLTVNTAGGILLSYEVRSCMQAEWGIVAPVGPECSTDWNMTIINALPGDLDNPVIFNKLPHLGDGYNSAFALTGTGAITGLPAGAIVEYSTDATSATDGTWSTNPSGATSVRITLPTLAAGETIELIWPTITGTDATGFHQQATNDYSVTGQYAGADQSFTSNEGTVLTQGNPAFTLVKRTNGVEYDAAPGAGVAIGSEVEWTYTVTNTGDTPLYDIELSDEFAAGDGSTGTMVPVSIESGPLLPGESRTYTATDIAIAGQYSNVVTGNAVATNPEGTPLAVQPAEQSDDSWYYAGASGITVVKTTNGQSITSAPGITLEAGSEVTWTYTVTNTGTTTLTDVDVTDRDAAGTLVHHEVIPSLAAGASVTITAKGTATIGQYHNTVTVIAEDPSGGQLEAADESWYFGQDTLTTPVAPLPPTGGTLTVAVIAGVMALLAFIGAFLLIAAARRRRAQDNNA